MKKFHRARERETERDREKEYVELRRCLEILIKLVISCKAEINMNS